MSEEINIEKVWKKTMTGKTSQGAAVYHQDGIMAVVSAGPHGYGMGQIMEELCTVSYSKSTRDHHIDHRARVNSEANTISTGEGGASQSTQNFVATRDGTMVRIRRLTPVECERLMSWGSLDTIMETKLCSDQIKSFVHAVERNPKLLRLAERVGVVLKKESASNVELNSLLENLRKRVTVALGAEIASEKKLLKEETLIADNVAKFILSDLQKIKEISAVGSVSTDIIEGKITQAGAEGFLASETGTHRSHSGKFVVNMSGEETMLLAESVGISSITDQIKNSIYTISNRLDTYSLYSNLLTWYFYALIVTNGSILLGTQRETLSLTTKFINGWTHFGRKVDGTVYELNLSARYKACGNGVVSTVPEAILNKLIPTDTGIRIFSTFAGVDGSSMYLRSPKYTKVAFSEYDPKAKEQHAANVLRYHYPDVPNLGDITKVKEEEVPDHDLMFISAPCQAFSSAGGRAGFDDTRGTLFYETARILKYKKPKYFLFENVKGLATHDKGNTFLTMMRVYSALGYELDFELLNSKYFGVPQNRERIFMFGKLKSAA